MLACMLQAHLGANFISCHACDELPLNMGMFYVMVGPCLTVFSGHPLMEVYLKVDLTIGILSGVPVYTFDIV